MLEQEHCQNRSIALNHRYNSVDSLNPAKHGQQGQYHNETVASTGISSQQNGRHHNQNRSRVKSQNGSKQHNNNCDNRLA